MKIEEVDYKKEILDYIRKNRVSTSEIADALGKSGVFPGVLPINNNHYRIGEVRCVFASNNSNYVVHEQIRDVKEDEVVIVFTHNCEGRAIVGDLVSKFTLLYKGASAIVVQGMVRDVASLRREGFAVWSEGVSPLGCFNTPTDPYPPELERKMRECFDGGVAVCDDGGVSVIPSNMINSEMLIRLNRIEMQEDVWYFCLDTLKWDTKKIVCDKAYLLETNLLSSVHIEQLNELNQSLDAGPKNKNS